MTLNSLCKNFATQMIHTSWNKILIYAFLVVCGIFLLTKFSTSEYSPTELHQSQHDDHRQMCAKRKLNSDKNLFNKHRGNS